MLRMIFKVLWARKRRYGWLLTELVLVTMIVWVLLDPLVVLLSIESMPNGFDERNLYRVVLADYNSHSSRFRSEEMNPVKARENRWSQLRRIRAYPGVESATFFGNTGPFWQSSYYLRFQKDTLVTDAWVMEVVPGSDYFQTLRFTEVGGQTNEQLDRLLQGEPFEQPDRVVLSDAAFPGQSARGLNDTVNQHQVVGTTALVRMRVGGVPMPVTSRLTYPSGQSILFRVRDGIDEDKFLPAFTEWARNNLQVGNSYVRSVQSFRDFMHEDGDEVRQNLRVRTILAGFFLFFLFMGVTGTFWMQTRSRREEIGILKSFGATRGTIVRSLLAEGGILATLAVIIGCFLYLQYAMKEGLYNPLGNNGNNIYTLYSGRFWFEYFKTHFMVISLITWVLLQLVVCLGIWIPARNLSRIPPTEALHED